MKKILFLASIVFIAFAAPSVNYQAKAQIGRQITITAADDTLVATDTANVSLTFDQSYKSVEAWIYPLTGTAGGKIVFQGQIPSGEWQGLDSLAITDVDSAAQFKLFTVPNPRLHTAYRLRYLKSGSSSAPIKAWYIRYTGGAILRSDPYNGLAMFKWPQGKYTSNWKGELFFQPTYKIRLIKLSTRSAA